MTEPRRHILLAADISDQGQDALPSDLVSWYRTNIRTAASGLLDFVLLRDARALDALHPIGRLDALSVAARFAPEVEHIGLVVGKQTSFSEPFTVSRELATLDLISGGRAGWYVQTIQDDHAAHNFGAPEAPSTTEQHAVAAEFIDVSRKLWDSWEDDAVIVDRNRGWYINPHKLHHIDHQGDRFQIRGPSITYRPVQGHVIVVQSDDETSDITTAATRADVIIQHHESLVDAQEAYAVQQRIAQSLGRDVRILQRIVIVHGQTTTEAYARAATLNAAVAQRAQIFAGTAEQIADQCSLWFHAQAADGFVIESVTLPADLELAIDHVIPELQRRGLFKSAYITQPLQATLGLQRPANQYANAASEAHHGYEGAQ